MSEFAMLSHVASTENCGGWYLSRKLNGWRCLYDGGITKGLRVYQVPWVKSTRYGAEMSTGLWTLGRSSGPQPIFCPPEFTRNWPAIPFDGELWHSSDDISLVKSICGQGPKGALDARWSSIEYMVFGYKPFCLWAGADGSSVFLDRLSPFYNNHNWAHRNYVLSKAMFIPCENITLVKQMIVTGMYEALSIKQNQYADAEGIMLANPLAEYQLKRTRDLLKVKDFYDIEAEIIGHLAGVGKHLGRMGALRCRVKWDEKVTKFYGGTASMIGTVAVFSVGGGFSDSQREWDWVGRYLRTGQTIKVKLLSVSKDGIPCSVQYEGEDHAP
jgi:hypothetical protein